MCVGGTPWECGKVKRAAAFFSSIFNQRIDTATKEEHTWLHLFPHGIYDNEKDEIV